MNRIIYIMVFLMGAFCNAQNETLFNEGNALYNEGKYVEAIGKYEKIVNTKNHAAALYFNMGNAHYKLNHIGPSIYYYEKALQLDPNDLDVKNNMSYAQNMTVDAIDVIPEVGLSKFIKGIVNLMSFDGWAKTAIILVIVFVSLFLMYHFSETSRNKRFSFVGSFIIFLFTCFSLAFAFHNYNLVQNDKSAIVFAQESKIKNEPNLRSDEVFKLHEGTKVQVLETIDDWTKIKLSDGKLGWIPNSDIKKLF